MLDDGHHCHVVGPLGGGKSSLIRHVTSRSDDVTHRCSVASSCGGVWNDVIMQGVTWQYGELHSPKSSLGGGGKKLVCFLDDISVSCGEGKRLFSEYCLQFL